MLRIFEIWFDRFVSVDKFKLFYKLFSGLDIYFCNYLGDYILVNLGRIFTLNLL